MLFMESTNCAPESFCVCCQDHPRDHRPTRPHAARTQPPRLTDGKNKAKQKPKGPGLGRTRAGVGATGRQRRRTRWAGVTAFRYPSRPHQCSAELEEREAEETREGLASACGWLPGPAPGLCLEPRFPDSLPDHPVSSSTRWSPSLPLSPPFLVALVATWHHVARINVLVVCVPWKGSSVRSEETCRAPC